MDGFSISTTNRDKNNFDTSQFLDEECVFVEKARRILRRAYLNGSPARARTSDTVVNSHMLYQLSYRGIDLYLNNKPCHVPTSVLLKCVLNYSRILELVNKQKHNF